MGADDPEAYLDDLRAYESERRERLWWVWAVVIFLVAFAAPAVFAAIVLIVRGDALDRDTQEVAISVSGVTGLVFGVGSLAAARQMGVVARDLGWTWSGARREWRNIGIGLAIAAAIFVFGVVYALVLEQFGVNLDALAPYEAARADIVVTAVFVVTAVAIAPVGEELFYRGFVTSMIERRFSRSPSVWLRGAGGMWLNTIVVSVIFAVSHGIPSAMLQLFVLAVMLSWARLKTGSLVAPITAHVVNNAISVSVLLAR